VIGASAGWTAHLVGRGERWRRTVGRQRPMASAEPESPGCRTRNRANHRRLQRRVLHIADDLSIWDRRTDSWNFGSIVLA